MANLWQVLTGRKDKSSGKKKKTNTQSKKTAKERDEEEKNFYKAKQLKAATTAGLLTGAALAQRAFGGHSGKAPGKSTKKSGKADGAAPIGVAAAAGALAGTAAAQRASGGHSGKASGTSTKKSGKADRTTAIGAAARAGIIAGAAAAQSLSGNKPGGVLGISAGEWEFDESGLSEKNVWRNGLNEDIMDRYKKNTALDNLGQLLDELGVSDLLWPGNNNKMPDLRPAPYNPYNAVDAQNRPKDNSFWEEHPDFLEIALEKMAQESEEKRKAQEAEDKLIQDLADRVPGWESMPSYEQNQIIESSKKINAYLTTFPDEFIELYEQWKALRSQTNTNNRSIVDNEAKLEKKEDELENTESFKKFVEAFGGLKFDFDKLPAVIIDILQLAYYGVNFAMVPPSAVAEAIASAGYDFADFLDASSLSAYLNKKWTIKNEIHQIELDIRNTRNNNYDIGSPNIGNHFSSDTIKSLENKMERKYPGMRARYEKYLNGNNSCIIKPMP